MKNVKIKRKNRKNFFHIRLRIFLVQGGKGTGNVPRGNPNRNKRQVPLKIKRNKIRRVYMKTKTKKWTLFTALATAFVSVLSLAFAVMPKTTTAVAQSSNDPAYLQALSALDQATKYTITTDSVGGNMTIGGGKADTPAPIGTKMYFSYTVESATAEWRGGYYEEGLSVFKISDAVPFGTYAFDKGLTRYEAQCGSWLLQNSHTYYCIIFIW